MSRSKPSLHHGKAWLVASGIALGSLLGGMNQAAAQPAPRKPSNAAKDLKAGAKTDTVLSGTFLRATQMMNLINDLRRENRKPALKSSAKLDKVAQSYAQLMASKDRVQEVDRNTAADRLSAAGYAFTVCQDQSGMQSGQKDPAAAQVQEWSNRRGRTKLLADTVTEIGVGVAASSTGKVYFYVVMAKPK